MKKVIVTLFMIASLCILMLVQTVFADATGQAGTNITWVYREDTKTLTLSGSGKMNAVTWNAYSPVIKELVISEGITSISPNAFANCTSLERVYLPTSITHIYADAFSNCNSLEDVYIKDLDSWFKVWMPNAASPLCNGANLYVNGELLTEVVIKTEQLSYFFPLQGCSSLKKITFNNGSVVSDYFLTGCSNLEEVNFRDTIWYIGKSAFSGCRSLRQLTLPEATATIEDYAFAGCTGLTEFTWPDKVPIIDNGVFSGCTNLEQVKISPKTQAKKIYSNAFANCKKLKEFIIPEIVTQINSNAFSGCESLTSIHIPAAVTSIGTNPFDGCSNLKEITVDAGNTAFCMGDDDALYTVDKTRLISFAYGNRADSYTMPATVSTYDKGTLFGLKRIDVNPQNTTYASDEYGVLYSQNMRTLKVYPSEAEHTVYRLPANISVESEAFTKAKNLQTLYIPQNTTVYQAGFSNMPKNLIVYVSPGTTSEKSAIACGFDVRYGGYLNQDTQWSFSDGCLRIFGTGEAPYIQKSSSLPWISVLSDIKQVVIEEGITSIKGAYFAGSTNLEEVVIADSVELITSKCFENCTSLTRVKLGSNLKRLDSYIFQGCTALKSISLPSSLTSVNYSFSGCTSLEKIEISDLGQFQSLSDTTIFYNHDAVLYCNGEPVLNPVISENQSIQVYKHAKFVESITYAEGVTDTQWMGDIYARKICLPSTIKTFAGVGDYVEEIYVHPDNPYFDVQDNVLYNKDKTILIQYPKAKANTTFTVPNGVIHIEAGAFSSNEHLTEIILPKGLLNIHNQVFYECYNLEKITLPEGLLTIGKSAFQYTKITYLSIPDSVYELGDLGFSPTIEGYEDSTAHHYAQLHGLQFVSLGVSKNTIDYGSFGDNLRWRISDDHILYISGNGEIPDFNLPTDAPWHQHMGWIERIILEKNITAIGTNSFSDFSGKKHIIVLGDITSVSQNAFVKCDELTLCGYPSNALEAYALQNSIPYIAINDFGFASQTVQWMFTTDNRLIFIGSGYMQDWPRTQDTPWYSYKKKIVAVEINEGIKNIGGWSLSGCTSLTSLVVPNSVESIADYSLNGCSSLEELTLPFIGRTRGGEGKESSVFGSVFGFLGVGGSASLSGATVQRFTENMDKDTYIGAFIPPSIKKVTITDEPFIAFGAFYNCRFEEIVLPEGITHISPYAFYNSAAKVTYPGTAKAWERIQVGEHNTININITGVDRTTAEPSISVSDVVGGKVVTITAESKTNIYYTLDGSEPTHHSNLYSGEIFLSDAGEYEMKAIAILRGYDESFSVSETVYVPKADKPVASLESGLVSPKTVVSLSADSADSKIFYTLDGSTPNRNSSLYSEPFEINGMVFIRAISVKNGYSHSEIAEYRYVNEYTTPIVKTKDASFVSKYSAVLNGEIDNLQELGFYDVEFVYYPEDNPAEKNVVKAGKNLSYSLENLKEDTLYCYYIQVTNGDQCAIGNLQQFRTKTYEIPLEITLNHKGIRLQNGREYQLNVTVFPQTAQNQQMSWRSSNERVATVTKNGIVKTHATGTAVITATAKDGGASSSCEIFVYNKYVTESVDISELNIATNTQYYAEYGFTHPDKTEAGNNSYALAYLTRWDGAVSEEKDENLSPTASSEFGWKLEDYYLEVDADYHIQNAYILPVREDANDNDELKRAIKKYGAVAAIMYADPDRDYGYGGSSYYYNGLWNWSVGNHLITLVGWDDNYPASNFIQKPAGNGAFIVKNSWGEDYADDGFFYISYYDDILARYTNSYVYPELETKHNYNNIWQYDYTGPSYKMGYENSTYAANVFPEDGKALANDELLRAVSFHTAAQDMGYEIYVVDNYINENSLKINTAAVKSGTLHEMGYHTVELDQYIPIKAGNRFAVIVRLIAKDGATANMLVEKRWSINSNMKHFDNVGFYSTNGVDWSEIFQDTNICIKAFTDFSDIRKAKTTVYQQNETTDTQLDTITISDADTSYRLVPYHTGGLFPDMMDTIKNDFVSDIELPSRYDLRELSQTTPSKDQGGFGLCWCFGAAGSVESGVLKRMEEGALNGRDNNRQADPSATIQYTNGSLHVNSTVDSTLYVVIYDDDQTVANVDVIPVNANHKTTVPFDNTRNSKAFVWYDGCSPLCEPFSVYAN